MFGRLFLVSYYKIRPVKESLKQNISQLYQEF